MKSVSLSSVAAALVILFITMPLSVLALEDGTWTHFNRQAPTSDIRTMHLLADGTVWATTAAAFHEFDGVRWHKHTYDTARFGNTAPFFADSTGVFYFYRQPTKTVSAWDARHPESPVAEYVFDDPVNKVDGAVQGDDGIYIFSKSNGLYRLHDGVLDRVRAGKTCSIAFDHTGRLWAVHQEADSTSYGLLMRDGGDWTTVSSGYLPPITSTTVAAAAPDGAVWINSEGRHSVLRDGIWTSYSGGGEHHPVYISFGADGSVWGIVNTLLYRRTGDDEGTWELTNQLSQLETHKTPCFFVSPSAAEHYIYDHENVYRYNESAITQTHIYPWEPLPNPYDLGSDMVTSLAFTSDGYLVCGHGDPLMDGEDWGDAGLSYFDGETWHNSTYDGDVRYENVFAITALRNRSVMVAADGSYSLNFNGRTWSVIDSLDYHDDYWQVRKGLDYVEDSSGDLWIGTSHGLLEHNYIDEPVLHASDEQPSYYNWFRKLFIYGGTIYMEDGTSRSIVSYNPNSSSGNWTKYDYISNAGVRDFIVRNLEGSDPWIWAAMGDGIYLWQDDSQIRLTTASAEPIVLPDASLITVDDDDHVWASGFDNTGYLDEDGVWRRVEALAGMQANAFACYYDERFAVNSITIEMVDMQETITSYDGIYLFIADGTGVAEDDGKPMSYGLSSNYPNPFNASTTIAFDLPVSAHTVIGIYTLSGQRVRTLADHRLPSGANHVIWDGRDDHDQPVASGMYLYRIMAGPATLTGKMLLLK